MARPEATTMEVEAEDEQERPCSFSFTYLSFHRSKEAMQLEPRSRVYQIKLEEGG